MFKKFFLRQSLIKLFFFIVFLVELLSRTSTVRAAGLTAGDPFLIRDTEAILVQPPATGSPGLNFSGVAFRRYQPEISAPIDSVNGNLYNLRAEILGEDEWAVPLYNKNGDLQMTTVDIEGVLTQVFEFSATSVTLQKLLFSSAATLNSDPSVGPSENNLRNNNTVFRFESDFLYRTQNNVEWRFTGESFFYRVNDDFFAPHTRIDLNGVESYSASNLAYNDQNNVFSLSAYDPETINGSEVAMSGLKDYRYQWFPNTGDSNLDTCENLWLQAEASGSASAWVNIPPENLVTPDVNGFYHLTDVLFTDSQNVAPGSFSLCFQARDQVENIGSTQGKYVFVLPDFITLDCRDYQNYVSGNCTGSECETLSMAEIPGYGQSPLTTVDGVIGTNVGNTLNCAVTTNAQGGYELQLKASGMSAEMVHTDPNYNSHRLLPITNDLSAPIPWNVSANSANWGLRVHSGSGTDIYNPLIWGSDDYTGGNWAGVTNNNQSLYRRTENLNLSLTHEENSASDQALIQFGAEIGSIANLVSGNYKLGLEITAVTLDVNP